MEEVTKEKLYQDSKVVIQDIDVLMKEAFGDVKEKAAAARVKIDEILKQAKNRYDNVEAVVAERSKAAAKVTDQYVRENPYKAIGIGFGVGLLVGMILTRRD